jgi:nitroreductase
VSQLNAPIADPASVDAAIESRYSVRAFLPTPVPRPLIEDILRVASRAPSGTNAQPWKVYVLQGAVRDELVRQVSDAHEAIRQRPELAAEYREAYDYYPRQWVEPYLSRRRHNGWSLYGLLGIERGDKDRMHAQHHRNYGFFDAPVGLMFTLERVMGQGSLVDYGMFLQNIMLVARARGLHTCDQHGTGGFVAGGVHQDQRSEHAARCRKGRPESPLAARAEHGRWRWDRAAWRFLGQRVDVELVHHGFHLGLDPAVAMQRPVHAAATRGSSSIQATVVRSSRLAGQAGTAAGVSKSSSAGAAARWAQPRSSRRAIHRPRGPG